MKRGMYILFILTLVFSFIGCASRNNTQPVNNNLNEVESTLSKEAAEEREDQSQSKNTVEPNKQENPTEDNNQESTTGKDNQNETEKSGNLQYIAPLTGLPIDHDVKNRIIGVMINNHTKARPQSGLMEADMVYELLAEGPITRFIAIYQSQQPQLIGPVRSIRPYYLDIINGFDAVIVHAGSSQAALAILQTKSLPDLDEIENAGDAFWRASFREMPHNVYTSTNKITQAAQRRRYRSVGYIPRFPFLKETDEVTGKSAKTIQIKYDQSYTVAYQYDESTKLYKRLVNGKPHTDLETKQQFTAKNLLVIRTDHKIIDEEGRREIDVYGPGSGYLFQNGIVKEITWQRKNGVIRPFINGEEQGLFSGQSWIMVIKPETNVSYK